MTRPIRLSEKRSVGARRAGRSGWTGPAPTVPRLAIVAALVLHAGCECGGERPVFVPSGGREPFETGESPRAAAPRLVPATRTDLPRAVPAITVRVDGSRIQADDESWLASWPPAERERVVPLRPAGAPLDWPLVRGEVALAPDALLVVPDLVALMRMLADVERVRSGVGSPTAFAVRVTPESPWSSVVRAVLAAGMAGFSEPRFVLAHGQDEVELRLSLPGSSASSSPGPMAGLDLDRAIDDIQRALLGEIRDEMPAEGRLLEGGERAPDARPAPYGVNLEHAGLTITRGTERLGLGCRQPALGVEPSLPMATLNPQTLRDCLAAAGPSSSPYTFEAGPDVPFARVAPVLELLDRLGGVVLVTRIAR